MKCPWCELYSKFQLTFFLSSGSGATNTQSITFSELAERLLQSQPPCWRGRSAAAFIPQPFQLPTNANTIPASYWAGLAIIGLAAVALYYDHWFIAVLICAWGMQTALSNNERGITEIRGRLHKTRDEAAQRREQIEKQLNQVSSECAKLFAKTKSRVNTIRNEYNNLGAERQKRFAELGQLHAKFQLEDFLDKYFIEHASIPGFGSRRKSVLVSYGVETAKDIHLGMGIPGLGPDLEQRLMDWRSSIAGRFSFNPAKKIDPREYQKIDDALGIRRNELEQQLTGSKETLDTAIRKTSSALQKHENEFTDFDNQHAQAQADLSALSAIKQSNEPLPQIFAFAWAVLLLLLVLGLAKYQKQAPTNVYPTPELAAVPTLVAAKPQESPKAAELGKRTLDQNENAAEKPKIAQSGRILVRSNRANTKFKAVLVQPNNSANEPIDALGINQSTPEYALEGLTPGRYILTGSFNSWPEIRRTVVVESGQTTQVTMDFKGGSLRLQSIPAGATVYSDGTALGSTPLVLTDLPPGERQLSMKYASWPVMPFTTTVPENGETTEIVRIPHGRLVVASTPAGATVLMHGQIVGRTPLTIEPLPVGTQQIELQAEDYTTSTLSVSVEDRSDRKIHPVLSSSLKILDPNETLRDSWTTRQFVGRDYDIAPNFAPTNASKPENGVVRNLSRPVLDAHWLRQKFRYSAAVKHYDAANGEIEFADQVGEKSKYRVVAQLSAEAQNDGDFKNRLLKGAIVEVSGRLTAVEEPRWPLRTIVLKISNAQAIR